MRFFMSWCLRPIVGDAVLVGDDHLLVTRCIPWSRRVSMEWGMAGGAPQRRGGVGQREQGDGRGGAAKWAGRTTASA
jgi:hypothetical protein